MKRLGRRPDGLVRGPLEDMTGILSKRPLLRELSTDAEHASAETIDRSRVFQLIRF